MSRLAFWRGRIESMEPARRLVVRTRRLMVSVGLVVAVAAAGCTKDSGRLPASTSTTVATTAGVTTTTVDATEAAVLAGYRAFWVAYLKAADPMDPKHPDLAATATGAQLDQVARSFLALMIGGEVIRGRIEPHPQLAGPVQGTTAMLNDCYVDDSYVFDAATGTQKGDPAVVTQQVKVEMALVGTAWKVAAVRHEAKGCTPA